MPWSASTFPHEPRDSPSLQVLDNAQLSHVRQGKLRTWIKPDRWITGAVYDAKGNLVVESQRTGGFGGNRVVSADFRRIDPEPERELLTGRWLYGGSWMMHFGHFFAESITTLWPRDQQVDGLVFHRYMARDAEVAPWHQRLVDLSGYAGLPIRIIKRRALDVEHLVLPTRSVVANGWAHPGARDVWRRIAEAVPPGRESPARIYLSRTGYNESLRSQGEEARTSAETDATYDQCFAAAGFEVVRPEELDIDDQIRAVRSAQVIAGQSGSALHLSALAPEGAKVLELGDARMPNQPVAMQSVINTISGHEQAFVEHGVTGEVLSERLRELDLL